jgi:hypothetical protein
MNKAAVPYISIHEDCFDFADLLPRRGSQQLVRDLPGCFLGGKSIPLLHGRRPEGDVTFHRPNQCGRRVAQAI